ncbi:MFS transporter [Sphingobacterium allocomposti]|uniref:MFS transporter n=1 Tax=Sphingobacterium allocomposti TaxID=415956 RepID=A0A5S5DAN1_9SPHI|nr:MFS transporter [Sphingobacterium composti Yoo et al. 2007 non Ten et al. 2007]TYP92458.1 MFS transporter [Sphingobacterium composti Yoo et al. 2007 non Ten et al. 2007]
MLKPKLHLQREEVERGLRMIIVDGLGSEVVVCLTSGAFLVGLAIMLGASNFQIGLLAAFPTLTNLTQVFSVMLIRAYPNRRVITVFSLMLARLPLCFVGLLLYIGDGIGVHMLLLLMFVHYLFSSLAGAGWNSWVKDLVPEERLGRYFSKRSRYMQTTNIVLSLAVAWIVDAVGSGNPERLPYLYGIYFLVAGITGLLGAYFLSKAPEPQSFFTAGNLLKLLELPLRDDNFRRLLWFNGAWVFAINLAIPFFSVFLLKSLGLSMTAVILLTVVGQVFSVLTIQLWGKLSDKYSNKSIISLAAPIYILCILCWIFVGIYSRTALNIMLLFLLYMFTGVSTAGINLALTNIGLKLAPKTDAVVYISIKNIVTAFFSSMGPIVGGWLADFFAVRELRITIEWISPGIREAVKLIYLHEWNFLFLIAAVLAFFSLRLLGRIKENGEVGHMLVKRIMKTRFKSNMKEAFIIGNLMTWHSQIRAILRRKTTDGGVKA